jgi:hypothetical protein
VHKGSTQTNKKIKLGFKRKEQKKPKSTLVWHTVLSVVPPDSVRCTRIVQVQTLHLRVSQASLRYNSPDCPVCHRTVRCDSRATALRRNGRLQSAPNSTTVRAEVRAAARGAPDSEQCLSGATRSQRSNGRLRQNPNDWVTWLAHRTIRCAHRQQPPPTVVLVVEGYKIPPNHLHSNHPNIHHSPFNTRAKCNTPRHKSKTPIRSKSPIQF